MDVDRENEGRWLIPDSDDPRHIRWQRVMEAQDQSGGVKVARRVIDEMQGSREEIAAAMSGVYPYQYQRRSDWTNPNGQAYNTLPPGSSWGADDNGRNEVFQVHQQPLLQDRKADNLGQMYSYTNPSQDGAAAQTFRNVHQGLEPYERAQDSNRDGRREGRPSHLNDGYGMAQASNVAVRDFDDNPYQKESFAQEKVGESGLSSEIRDMREAAGVFTQTQLEQADGDPYNVAHVNPLDTLENRQPRDEFEDEVGDSYATQPKYATLPQAPRASNTVTAPPEADVLDIAGALDKVYSPAEQMMASPIDDQNAGQFVGMDTAAVNSPSALVKRGRSDSMQMTTGAMYGDVVPKKPRTYGKG